MEAHLVNESIHLGSTLYGRRWWGTQVNAEAKLLLLRHCFEACGFGRVKIQTDALNTRSQAAIAKLGARREGVLRRDTKREDGSFRDTVVFSVLVDEWPTVEAGLERRLRD
jgi:RimJ/RimL family protein N-acetyltransferase